MVDIITAVSDVTITSSLTTNASTWGAWSMNYTTLLGAAMTPATMAAIQAANMNLLAHTTNDWIYSNWVIESVNTGAITTTGTMVTTYSWRQWNTNYTTTTITGPQLRQAEQMLRAPPPSAEEIRRRMDEQKRLSEEREIQRLKLVAEQAVARAKGMKLLVSCLLPEQKKDLEEKKYFILESIGKDGKRTKYRIDQGTHGNVKLLDEKLSVVGSYCVQPNDVVVEDSMLAQKLWLESDPDAFKRAANYTPACVR